MNENWIYLKEWYNPGEQIFFLINYNENKLKEFRICFTWVIWIIYTLQYIPWIFWDSQNLVEPWFWVEPIPKTDLVVAAENSERLGVKLATEGDLLCSWVKPDFIIRLERFLFDDGRNEFDFFEVEPIFFKQLNWNEVGGLVDFSETWVEDLEERSHESNGGFFEDGDGVSFRSDIWAWTMGLSTELGKTFGSAVGVPFDFDRLDRSLSNCFVRAMERKKESFVKL